MELPPISHIAIIMDGNGRWAKKRYRPRRVGHMRGASVVSDIIRAADDFNVKALTLYAFSTENWSRPIDEVKALFGLLKKYLLDERQRIIDNNICFRMIGDVSHLPLGTLSLVQGIERETSSNDGLNLSFAFDYGGRKEIADAVNFYINENPGKKITEQDIQDRLLTNEVGDVDLLIRTGGNYRISNFLIWQNSYAEIFFSQTFWPDFKREEFLDIIKKFHRSQRRFGSIDERENIFPEAARLKGLENKLVFTNEMKS